MPIGWGVVATGIGGGAGVPPVGGAGTAVPSQSLTGLRAAMSLALPAVDVTNPQGIDVIRLSKIQS